MEPPSPETSGASDPQEPDRRAASASPGRPGGEVAATGDAATGPRAEENAPRGWPDEALADTMRFPFSESCANTNQASARPFLENLWRIVGSRRFQSIWWGNDGKCVIIAEKLFSEEVLGRRGPLRLFEVESMGGFILQLNLHGFCEMKGDSLLSASIEELRAVAAAGSALGKV
ncbi:HSFY1 protein, partial [Mesembrinibis cayennensis]|nr:HSFY1 protein [Mesembrinibis cayennensis]